MTSFLLFVSKLVPLLANFTFTVFTALSSVLLTLIPICVARAKNIPQHIKVILHIYNSIDPDSHSKKIFASILLFLSVIINFITFSWIPFTGTPILGLLTMPIAAMLSFILICLSYEILLPLINNGEVDTNSLQQELKDALEKLKDDYLTIKNKLGPLWDKHAVNFKKLIEDNADRLSELELQLRDKGTLLFDEIENYITPSLEELSIYINNNADSIKLEQDELNIIQEKIESWKKVGVSAGLATGAGIGTAVATQSILVPTTLWNTTLSALGFSSGIMVSSTTMILATTVLPVTIGGTVFLGAMYGFKTIEKKNLSKFMTDVIISSMPMIYADGKITDDEIFQFHKLSLNPVINDEDRKRITDALKNPVDLEYIFNNQLMYEKNTQKSNIKSRLLLSITWEIAKVDKHIDPKEIELHERIAKILDIENNYAREVRTLLTPNLVLA